MYIHPDIIWLSGLVLVMATGTALATIYFFRFGPYREAIRPPGESPATEPARREPRFEIIVDWLAGHPRGAIVPRSQLLRPDETEPPFLTIDRLIEAGAIRYIPGA